jgi:uncharacterized protein YdaU (DUF1376 family)
MNKNRTVYRRDDGKWVNKRNDAERASTVHDTQKEATDTAKEMLRNQGGGEVTVQGTDKGQFRKKDTVPPGNDPCPPKDKEH